MPSKKASVISRVRFDALYMVVALFAVLGGYTLLGSYADSKAPPTLKPGSYKLANYTNGTTVTVDLRQGLTYCFMPFNVGQAAPIIRNADGSQQSLALQQVAPDTACFTPAYSQLKVGLSFNAGAALPTTLLVR